MYLFDKSFSISPSIESFKDDIGNLKAPNRKSIIEANRLRKSLEKIDFKINLEKNEVLTILTNAASFLHETQFARTRLDPPVSNFMIDNSLEARWSRFQNTINDGKILRIDAENLWLIGSEVRESLAFGAMLKIDSAKEAINNLNEVLYRRIIDDLNELKGGISFYTDTLSGNLFALNQNRKLSKANPSIDEFSAIRKEKLAYTLKRAVYGVGVSLGARVHDIVDWDDSEIENTKRVKSWKNAHGQPVTKTAKGIGGSNKLKKPIHKLNSVDLGSAWITLEGAIYDNEKIRDLEMDFILRSKEELKRFYLIYFGGLLSSILNDFDQHHPDLTDNRFYSNLEDAHKFISDSLTFYVSTGKTVQFV